MDPRLTDALMRAHIDDLRRKGTRRTDWVQPRRRRRRKPLAVPQGETVAADALALSGAEVGAPRARRFQRRREGVQVPR